MIQKIVENPETLVSAIIFARIFFAGPRLRLVLETKKVYRRIISLDSGIAIAYVFMAFLPELSEASALFVEETHHLSLISPEHRVYGASLLGFILFYSIEYLAWPPAGSQEAPEEDPKEWIRFVATIAAYSLYAGLICYLLVHSLEGGYTNEAIYTLAMALHFTSLRYSLWKEYESCFSGLYRVGSS